MSLSLWHTDMIQVAVVNVVDYFYLCPQPLAEASGYHAPGVGLDGQHSTQTAPKRLPDEETSATGLDESYTQAGFSVVFIVFPGPVHCLETHESREHLRGKEAGGRALNEQ